MGRPRQEVPEESLISVSFLRSLPLFLAAALFFAVGAAVLVFDPRYGPGAFTLWALLITLGFVSCIGGVASWLLVGEPGRPSESAARPVRTRPPADEEPEEERPEPLAVEPTEFGRPIPAVRARSASSQYAPRAAQLGIPVRARPEWDEDAELPVAGPVLPTISAADALRDLDGIEQELVPRTPGHPTAPTPA
jgi:hypothetical protein